MSNVKENELNVDEGVRGYLRVSQQMELTVDEVAELFNDLPIARRMELIMAMVQNAEGVIDILRLMGTDDRMQVLREFCRGCGADDPCCRCDCPDHCAED